MADPPAIARLVAAVVKAVDIPVTLKIRTGPDAPARDSRPGSSARGTGGCCGRRRPCAQRRAKLRRRPRLVRRGPRQTSGQHPGARQRRCARSRRRDPLPQGDRGRRRGHWPWLPRQSVDLSASPGARPGGGQRRGPQRRRTRAGVLLQLVEGEFATSTEARSRSDASRAWPATSPSSSPIFPSFREQVQRVKNFPDFKRLVRAHFAQ
jgi:hypothetical protein